jgi:hypothetical protein
LTISVLIGTGEHQVFLDEALMKHFADLGIDLITMDTPNALSTYNILLQEDRNVVCGLITIKPIKTKEITIDMFKKQSLEDIPKDITRGYQRKGRNQEEEE